MIDLVVVRGAADTVGEPIVEALLCATAAALERGRVEVDRSHVTHEETLSVPYRPGLVVGAVILVVDALQGQAWRGIVSAVSLAVEGVSLTASITVQRSV